MKISKKSWHYRLYSCYGDGPSYVANLCPYMRRVGLGILMVILITGSLTMVSLLILEPIAILILWMITGSFYLNFFGPNEGVVLFADIALISIGLFCLMFIGGRQMWHRASNSLAKEVDENPDGFLKISTTWLKAVHEKICPTIETID